MSIGAFVDKKHRPTTEEIVAVIGSKRPLWENLIQFIADNFRVQEDLTFYGRNYGWAIRFRKGGKALASLYPRKEGFTVQIVLDQAQVEKARCLSLGKGVRRILEDAREFPEGRWLLIKVESDQEVNDVKRLLMIKS